MSVLTTLDVLLTCACSPTPAEAAPAPAAKMDVMSALQEVSRLSLIFQLFSDVGEM